MTFGRVKRACESLALELQFSPCACRRQERLQLSYNVIPNCTYPNGAHFVFTGLMYDKTGDYNIPFYVGGTVKILGGLLVVIAEITRRQRTTLHTDT